MRWDLYGLTGNPFELRPLNPLVDSEDTARLIDVDGFRRFGELDGVLRETIAKGDSCVFLVTGESGCGRSSIANRLLDRYRELRKIERRFFVTVPHPERLVDSSDPVSVFQKWGLDLANEIETLGLMSGESLQSIRMKISAPVTPVLFAAAIKPYFKQMIDVLSDLKEPAGIGVCLEEVKPDSAFIFAALRIFSRLNTIVILTALDTQEVRENLLQPFVKKEPAFRHVELSGLDWEDVKLLVSKIWEESGSKTQIPFPFGNSPAQFARRQRPLGRTLYLFNSLLRLKLARPDREIHELNYTMEEFYSTLDILEENVG